MDFNALSDICLQKASAALAGCDVLSLDVFDTLLLRTVAQPADIFWRVGEAAAGVPGFGYAPDAYLNLRVEAEKRARQKKKAAVGSTEIAFGDIFAEMPFPPHTLAALQKLELRSEREALYLNPGVAALAYRAAEQGKKVVIVSDMYHSARQIRAFLRYAGFDTSVLHAALISCEAGCSKRSGRLFDRLKQCFPGLPPNRILHLGDNAVSDVAAAELAGLRAAHYDVIPQEFGSIYETERSVYGVNLGELAALRKLAAVSHSHDNDEEAFFHGVGAALVGPVYTLFAEWVADRAQEGNFGVVLPFMREGELLAELIGRVLAARGSAIECRPLYISRHVTFAANLRADTLPEKVDFLLIKAHHTLDAIFAELGLTITTGPFAGLAGATVGEADSAGQLQAIRDYLNNDAKAEILAYATRQRQLLLQNLRQAAGGRRALTVDLGTKGTTESQLHALLRDEDTDITLSHALLLGADGPNVDNILNGVPIRAWLGIAGENGDAISRIMYQIPILEALVNATCGTTVGYHPTERGVEPLLAQPHFSPRQRRQISVCWGGVRAFFERWLWFSGVKPGLRETLLRKKTDFLGILLRLIEMPKAEEARRIGQMRHLDDFSRKEAIRLCDTDIPDNLDDAALEQLASAGTMERSYWPQAAIALKYPQYFAQRLIKHMGGYPGMSSMAAVLARLKRDGCRKIAVFGAAERGRVFARLAKLYGLDLCCLVDSNPALQGKIFEGLPVCALAEAEDAIDAFVIASFVYSGEIRLLLDQHYANRPMPAIHDFSAGV